MDKVEKPFSFGKNWSQFLGTLDEERFKVAEESLTDFLGTKSLKGMTFLDIGSGSGLFSHAAFRLGAEKVVSVDVDRFSVQCTRFLHEKAGSPPNWEVHEGSILIPSFMSTLGTFDIVYSWGVLHSTGRMWESIENAGNLVKEGGCLYISIYNKVEGVFGSKTWLLITRFYNWAPGLVKRLIEVALMGGTIIYYLGKLQNPIKVIRHYKSRRGMDWRTDIIDWLGKYPYEYATVEEMFKFVKSRMPDFQLANIKTTNGLATNWFLFRRTGQ